MKFSHYCIATIVMYNDDYVGGAVCLAKSIRKAGNTSDLVCLFTNDLTPQGIRLLDEYFDYIVEIPYVEHRCVPVRWKRFEHMYRDWISRSFTKIQILTLTMYHKVFFIDADMLCLGNIEPIFKLPTPAGCISDRTGNGLPHGALISQGMIGRTVKELYGVSAGCWLLRPSLKERDDMVHILESCPVFGNYNYNAGPDEVLTTLYYTRPVDPPLTHDAFIKLPDVWSTAPSRWLNIGREFNCLAWHKNRLDSGNMPPATPPPVVCPSRPEGAGKPARLANGDYPLWYRVEKAERARVPRKTLIIHFATEKPWDCLKKGSRIWPDFRLWFDLLDEIRTEVGKSEDESLRAALASLPPSPPPDAFISEEEAERIYQEEKAKRRRSDLRQTQQKRNIK